MAGRRYTPGQWVRAEIPTGSVGALMGFGGDDPQPAYIENVNEGGTVRTYAQRRCPKLPSGRHRLVVQTRGGEVVETAIYVA